MKITNPLSFIVMGGRLRYLMSAEEGNRICGENYYLGNLKRIRKEFERLGFPVTRNVYRRELADIEEQLDKIEADSADPDSEQFTEGLAKRLRDALMKVETAAYSEAETRVIAYPVPRRFALDHLLDKPGGILAAGVYDDLTTIAQSDLRDACRCIAFECATAAAFHMLRCLEECVRMLHRAYFPRGDCERPWGALISELRKKNRRPVPDETLLDHLDHFRARFRNPTDHPEKVYEIEEVEDLVHIAVDIVNRCCKDEKVQARKERQAGG